MQTEMREVIQSWGFYMGKCPVLEEIPVICVSRDRYGALALA